jgi:hypothetical protein
MKKPKTAPTVTTERRAYVLLSDGTPARRLKPIVISGRRYWNLAVTGDGKVKRVSDDRLADFCDILPPNPNA